MVQSIGPAISARLVSKSFGDFKALNSFSIDIPKGITFCLLGPNGSGKTTFIRAIVGLLAIDGGELQVLGEPVSRVCSIYSRIGYMTQHKALYPDLTLQENLEFYAGLYSIEKNVRDERISKLLNMVDLEEHRHRLAGSLSGGMYQRLSLACTLIHEPELLLLDEPTVGVDPKLRRSFWEYFERLTEEGKTIIITTHMMDEAERCKLMGYMRQGSLAALGSPDQIKSMAGLGPILELWLREPNDSARLLGSQGYETKIKHGIVEVSLKSHDQIRGVLDLVEVLDMKLHEPGLEEAFLRLSEAKA